MQPVREKSQNPAGSRQSTAVFWINPLKPLTSGGSNICRALYSCLTTDAVMRPIGPHTSQVLNVARAVAAGLVVLFHAAIYTRGNIPVKPADNLLYILTECGTQAVFWFFVISGYLVGGSVISEIVRTGNFNFRRYFVNRMTRLYVVLLPALALGAILDRTRISAWGINSHAGYETVSSLSGVTLLQNVFFLQTLTGPTFGSNYALWSLASEFWYYTIFPLMLSPIMIKRATYIRFMLFMIGILLILFITKHNVSMSWLFTLWFLGAAIRCVGATGRKFEILAWVVAILGMLAFPYLHSRVGPLATILVGVTFAGTILSTHGQPGKGSKRCIRIANAFSGLSFSLYLIHLPILHFVTTLIARNADPFLNITPHSIVSPAVIVGLVCVSYTAAFLFARITEDHTDAVRRSLWRIPSASLN
jgi:peptidoglycan/LPS O-acetylase OafA/YrhL